GKSLLHLFAGFFKNTYCTRRIENTTGTESLHIGHSFIGSSATFLNPVDHFLGQAGGNHAVAAHRRQREDLGIRQFFCLSFESQRVADAMTSYASEFAAFHGTLYGCRHIDRQTEVRFGSNFEELL